MTSVERKKVELTFPRIISMLFIIGGLIFFCYDANLASRYSERVNLDNITINDVHEGMIVTGKFDHVIGFYPEDKQLGTFENVNSEKRIEWDANYEDYIIPLNYKNKRFINYLVSDKDENRQTIASMTNVPSFKEVEFVGQIVEMPWEINKDWVAQALNVKKMSKVDKLVATGLAIKPIDDKNLKFNLIRDVVVVFLGGIILIVFGKLNYLFTGNLETIPYNAIMVHDYSKVTGSLTSLSTTYSEMELELNTIKRKYYGRLARGLFLAIITTLLEWFYYKTEKAVLLLVITVVCLICVKTLFGWLIQSSRKPRCLGVEYPLGFQMKNCKLNMAQIEEKIVK